MQVTTIGVAMAKQVFFVVGTDRQGRPRRVAGWGTP